MGWIPDGFCGVQVTTTEAQSKFDIWLPPNRRSATLYADPQFPELLVLELPSEPNYLIVWNPGEDRVTRMPNPSRINPSEARLEPSELKIIDLGYTFGQLPPDEARQLQDYVASALGYDPTQLPRRNCSQ